MREIINLKGKMNSHVIIKNFDKYNKTFIKKRHGNDTSHNKEITIMKFIILRKYLSGLDSKYDFFINHFPNYQYHTYDVINFISCHLMRVKCNTVQKDKK